MFNVTWSFRRFKGDSRKMSNTSGVEKAPIPQPSFVTYTKGAVQYVTTPEHETHFLNWLATVANTSEYTRETNCKVAVKGSPSIVHSTEKRDSAVVLKLVKDTTE
jgi:hypothetical protein